MSYTKRIHSTTELLLKELLASEHGIATFKADSASQANTFRYKLYNTLKLKQLRELVKIHYSTNSLDVSSWLVSKWGSRWKPEMEQLKLEAVISDPQLGKPTKINHEALLAKLSAVLGEEIVEVTGIDRIKKRLKEMEDGKTT